MQPSFKAPAVAVLLLLILGGCKRSQVPELLVPADDDPRLTFPTPYRNVRPDVRYVGDAVCAQCHPDLAESYRQHPMGRSLAPVARLAAQQRYDPAAHNPFESVGGQYLVDRQGDRIFHAELRRDERGQVLAETRVEIAYVVGSGTHGCSYLIERDGCLFQSPIAWFGQKAIWDLAPGFVKRHDRFERTVAAECLFCHCNHAEPVAGSINRYRPPIFQGYTIGCERCHGPGQLHVERRERGDPVTDLDDTIVQPRRLPPELREAVCQQCHLEGESRILRRGREPFDFRPGLPLELFWSVFVKPPELTDHKTVSSVEQMHFSRCFRESQGKMGCISCHDPHRLPGPAEKMAYYRNRCLTCHQEAGCSLPRPARLKKKDDCVACHMPAVNSSDAPHAAITDHRILRRADEVPQAADLAGALGPGRIPLAHFRSGSMERLDQEAARDLGLALVDLVRNAGAPGDKVGRLALPILGQALETWPDDVPALEAKSYALGSQGRVEEALTLCESILALAPGREQILVDAATWAKRLGRRSTAITYWQRALAVDPWRSFYRFQLASLLAETGEWEKALAQCRTLLGSNPGHVETRLLLVAYHARMGEKDKARAEFATIMALKPGEPDVLRRWFDAQMR